MAKPDKRAEIVKAALELIVEHGFHGAPMAMIAKKADVGAGTIYRYFESKDVLINELYLELENRLNEVIMENYPLGNPLRERFVHIYLSLLTYLLQHPVEFRYIEQFHNSPYGAAVRKDRILGKGGCNIIKGLFDEGITQQIIKKLPIQILFAISFSPLIAIVRDCNQGFHELNQQLQEQLVNACWDAIKR